MRKMSDDVIISGEIAIPLAEIEFSAVRSQGAGGQNVNKVASAIHLRFDIVGSASLPAHIRDRLLQLGDRRVTAEGVLVIKAQEHRTQERNRHAAVSRLRELIQSAIAEQKPRVATKPIRTQINEHFRSLGYKYVTLDLQGYRSGSLNEGVLKISVGHG